MTTPDIIAHRGGLWTGVGENTLESFVRSSRFGARLIETDVRASRDGVVYAVHDEHLRRLAGRDASISDLTAAELDDVVLLSGGALPRLTTVLEELPDTAFNIDVKDDRAMGPTIRALRAMAATSRVRIASFSSSRLARLRAALPGVRSSAGTAEVARFILAGSRRAARLHPGIDALQIPESAGPVRVLTRRLVEDARRSGILVHVWTVNDASAMRRVAAHGVDGIVTDRLELCAEVLGSTAPAV